MSPLLLAIPYLMAVSFYAPTWQNLKPSDLVAINESPYQGVMIPLLSEEDYTEIPTLTELLDSSKAARASTKKQLWPWISMNRIVAYSSDHHPDLQEKQNPYYSPINVIDLDNKAGALEDFYTIWRVALQLAKQTRAPGIGVDLEVYNNYHLYSLVDMAKELNLPPDVVKQKLINIGEELGRITAETYPNAILWHFFTGVDIPNYSEENGTPYYRSVAYIDFGILKFAKEHKVPLRVIEGGETTLKYFNPTLKKLEWRIHDTAEKLKPVMEKYPGELIPGGTIAPWRNADDISDFMIKWARPDSTTITYKTIDDFIPLFAKLFETYDYVWVYGAKAAPYNPFDVVNSKSYDPAIIAALKEAQEVRANRH